MIDYNIQAIPTIYRGQTFRSRLEAKWAAFFDLLEWEWCYEPFDFGGWSPDFAIRAPGASSEKKIVLAEVKPIMEFDEDVGKKMIEACPGRSFGSGEEFHRILDFDMLLLGLCPMEERLGWIDDAVFPFCDAVFGLFSDEIIIGFCSADGDWTDRITGVHNGHPLRSPIPPGTIAKLWGKASAAVQWHPPHSPRRT